MPRKSPDAVYFVARYNGCPVLAWMGETEVECRAKVLRAYDVDHALANGSAWDAFSKGKGVDVVPASLFLHAPKRAA